jgi:cell division protein FtsI (penicillin-binding protein 3)
MNLELQKGSRSRILAGLIFVIVGIFVIRLFYLQIIQHNYYVGLADNEQIKILTFPAKRGLIYAMDGSMPVQLVLNQTVYTVIADPLNVKDDQKVIEVIHQIAGGNARPNLDTLLANKESRYAILATKISQTQAQKIKDQKLFGIILQQGTQRVYPEATLAAQTLGFVNDNGVGQYGIEGALNSQLKGTDGVLKTVTDVSDVPLTIGDKNINKPAVNGKNVVLSIDRNIQAHTEQALADGLTRTGATNGSAVVMDPNTGRVLAMANIPTYNPASYSQVQDANNFNNPIVSSPYEPGSDIKTFTFATAIEKGVVTPESTYNNTDYINVGDITITNATKGQTGIITIQHAFTWSLNTGFVTVAQRLGDGTTITDQARNTMYDYFHNKFGLGALTGIELTGEAVGTVIPPTDPQGNAARYSNMSFGQGLDATMIQVVTGFSSVINGGHYYKPTVIAGSVDASGSYNPLPVAPPIRTTISQSTSDQMRTALQVARALFDNKHDLPGYIIGGKTGTSQVAENGTYANNETIGTYLGFGGNDTPKYAIMIQLSGKNKELQGEKHAMPVFTDISNWLLNYLKIQPKG